MSSTIASASRNSFAPTGTRLPSSAITPTEKAMSVAIGIPQPGASAGPLVHHERHVDEGRDDHPAECGHRRKGRLLDGVQLADDQLALDLETDDEEEDRHQAVVDEVLQRLVEVETADRDRDVRFPELEVRVTPRRVRPDERGDRGGEQHDGARRLGRHERRALGARSAAGAAHRCESRFGEAVRCLRPCVRGRLVASDRLVVRRGRCHPSLFLRSYGKPASAIYARTRSGAGSTDVCRGPVPSHRLSGRVRCSSTPSESSWASLR